jgi:lipopolysaccharide transport protein LptA
MSQKCKILLIIVGYLYLPSAASEDYSTLQNISIQANQVTIDEKTRKLTFQENITIEINSYIIKGSIAMLSHQDEKLEIYGEPATIQSDAIDGKAEKFVIYPNESMHLIGNAKLLNEGNAITSNFIAYKISANE